MPRRRSPPAAGSRVARRRSRRSAVEPLLPTLVLVWLAGVALLSLRLLTGWLWVQRLRTHGVAAGRTTWQRAWRAARAPPAHLRARSRCSNRRSSTCRRSIGWLKPVVLLPASALAGLTPQQLEAILAHELAHIRRHDYLVNLLQTLVETLLFYHPAVWWLSRRIRVERENCCDDLAVSLCGDPVAYADGARRSRSAASGPRRPSLAMAATGGSLLQRVRRLLGAPSSHAGRGPAGSPARVALLLIGGIAARRRRRAAGVTRRVSSPLAAADRSSRGTSARRRRVAVASRAERHPVRAAWRHRRPAAARSGRRTTSTPPSCGRRPRRRSRRAAPAPPAPPASRRERCTGRAGAAPQLPRRRRRRRPAPPVAARRASATASTTRTATGSGRTTARSCRSTTPARSSSPTTTPTSGRCRRAAPEDLATATGSAGTRSRSASATASSSAATTSTAPSGRSSRKAARGCTQNLPKFVRNTGIGAAGARRAHSEVRRRPAVTGRNLAASTAATSRASTSSELFKQATLTPDQYRQVMAQASREMHSDYELAPAAHRRRRSAAERRSVARGVLHGRQPASSPTTSCAASIRRC